MGNLPTILADKVDEWRKGGYACADFPLIGDILRFQCDGDGESGGHLRFLRAAQFAALETYWYLRLVRKTPMIMNLYKDFYPSPIEFIKALGMRGKLSDKEMIEEISGNGMDDVLAKIRDAEWAKEKKLDALHEAATLEYPGYIFALAMGAGKTMLIGAIIATEFALAMRYGGKCGDVRFMQNALVFAPGKTIIESLREISEMPMEKILPAQSLRDFQTSVSVVYPRDGQKEIPVITGGLYNIIVSNTEKIALRAEGGRKNQTPLQHEQKRIVANRRLQKIISLPNLGVFSDEAHHTYGNEAGKDLKRVRETVNYIHEKTQLVAAVNTTGTPYHGRRMLPDVVFWYGLREGIRDNVLKGLQDGVVSYRMREGDEDDVLEKVIAHFFNKYGKVRLPNGAPAKIAFYFKQQEHLNESLSHIQNALAVLKLPQTLILVNTQKSSKEEKDDFNRLNDPTNQKRVILLVQIGTEGWNCPSLFACALIKEQTGNVFVLQAATRCLRQTPGNNIDATVYLSEFNKKALNKGLQDNFGHDLDGVRREEPMREVMIELPKKRLPPMKIVRELRRIVSKPNRNTNVKLRKPKARTRRRMVVETGELDYESYSILYPTKEEKIDLREVSVCCYMAAARISANYHLKEIMPLLRQLKSLYPDGKIPGEDITDLMLQVERQTSDYEERVEKVYDEMELIREVDDRDELVFIEDAEGRRVFPLQFSESNFFNMLDKGMIVAGEKNIKIGEDAGSSINAKYIEDKNKLSYHYSPYCFDSAPEGEFFSRILKMLGQEPEDIRAFVFTGLANSRLTDLWFYYKGEDGAYHRYFPDFLLLKNSGEFFIVEIKSDRDRGNAVVQAKEKAVKMLADIPENRLRYVVIYVNGEGMESTSGMMEVHEWIKTKKKKEKNHGRKKN